MGILYILVAIVAFVPVAGLVIWIGRATTISDRNLNRLYLLVGLLWVLIVGAILWQASQAGPETRQGARPAVLGGRSA